MTSSSKRKVKPVAVGCVIAWSDFQIVLISFTCFAAFIIYGASNAALGASVPAMARALNKPESRIGFIFIFRGAGFLVGTLGSAALMGYQTLPLSKEVIVCLSSILMGVSTYLMSCTYNYDMVLGLSIFQGFGFGGVDCISNCLFPELWGIRIQPWMQALHLCFGIGAMIGPTLVGTVGYVTTYRVLGLLAFLPLAALQGYRFFTRVAETVHILADSDSVSATSTEQQIKDAERFKYVSTSITEDDDMNMDNTYSPFTGRRPTAPSEDTADDKEEDETITTHNPLSMDANLNNHRNDSSVSLSSTASTELEGDSTKSHQSEGDSIPHVGPPVTLTLRMLILFFYVIYTGSEAGFGGWIPVYVLREHITTTDSQAAFVAATFWATMTMGRTLAVLTAMFFSATFMLRFHLSFGMICCVLFMFVEEVGTYQYALAVAALMGLALSAIYPLVMTIVIDYGYTMDSRSTTTFMVGATMGEAGLPMALGLLLEAFGPPSMPWTILLCSILQLCTYGMIHVLGSQGTGGEHDSEEQQGTYGLISASGGQGVDEQRNGNHLMDSDSEIYSKIRLHTEDDGIETEGEVEMVDVRV